MIFLQQKISVNIYGYFILKLTQFTYLIRPSSKNWLNILLETNIELIQEFDKMVLLFKQNKIVRYKGVFLV